MEIPGNRYSVAKQKLERCFKSTTGYELGVLEDLYGGVSWQSVAAPARTNLSPPTKRVSKLMSNKPTMLTFVISCGTGGMSKEGSRGDHCYPALPNQKYKHSSKAKDLNLSIQITIIITQDRVFVSRPINQLSVDSYSLRGT